MKSASFTPSVHPSNSVFLGKGAEFLATRGEPPPWRRLGQSRFRGETHLVTDAEREAVRAAFYLRRPLLVTGDPGVGKSSLAYAIVEELGLDSVLVWPITSRTVLGGGLYSYDAVGRFHEQGPGVGHAGGKVDIARYLFLAALGTAMVDSTEERPRVLLIDEIDKSDVDLPNDLLHVLDEGYFVIPELLRYDAPKVEVRLHESEKAVEIRRGRVEAQAAPFILMTSNGEREFPPAFLRRCLRLTIKPPTPEELTRIVEAKLGPDVLAPADLKVLLTVFERSRKENKLLATDQFLNAAYLVAKGRIKNEREALEKTLETLIFQPLQPL